MTFPCGTPKSSKKTLSEKRVGDAALITGASSGLGRELAILFELHGNHVILSGRNEAKLLQTRDLCTNPGNITIASGDLRDFSTCQHLASLSDLYSLRYLILCAGRYFRGKFGEADLSWSLSVLESNTIANIQLLRCALPRMMAGSTIVHVNSVAGRNIAPEEAVYAASKHAMNGFLRAFRFEARERGIRVLDVFPGAIQTPMCAGRPGYDKMMAAKEAAQTIYSIATLKPETLQIEELHIGRMLP